MSIVVFGATGGFGQHLIRTLLQRGVTAGDIVATGRNEQKLAELAELGVAARRVDYNQPETVPAALEGAEKVMLISGNEVGLRVPQHAAGIKHLIYTSAPAARTSALVLAPEHKATEEAIEASGLAATILRNGWYTENYEQDFLRAKDTGVVANSVGAGRVASAPRDDFAEAAAVVLTTEGHENKVYELSGDVAWSFEEFAEAAS